jgi:hypothetical protein
MAEPLASERSVHKPDPDKVKAGDLHRFTYYAKVTRNENRGSEHQLQVEDVDRGNAKFGVNGNELIVHSQSADQVHEEVKWPLTKVAQLLTELDYVQVFTACFNKQGGEERVIHARLLPSPETSLGRSMCEDLDLPGPTEKRIRQIDRRTLKWLILDGVRYTVK